MKPKVVSFLFLLSLCLAACQKETALPSLEEKPYTFMVASDLHFLDPSLRDTSSPYYRKAIDNADGKITDYAKEILDAFFEEVRKQKPDALILTGDLSWNGAEKSHHTLAEYFAKLESEGIEVDVLPGNHDLGAYPSVCFTLDGVQRVDSLSPHSFRELDYRFGPEGAIAFAPDSFSYLLHPRKELYLLFLDSSSPGGDYVSKETVSWLENTVASLPPAATLLTFSHQNLLVHNPLFTTGMVIPNREAIQSIYASFPGKITNFAGHLHIQHIVQEEKLDEIDTGAMSVYPCRYGSVRVCSTGLSYEAKSVPVEESEKGSNDPNLSSFDAYGRSYFDAYSLRAFERFYQGQDEEEKQKAKEAFLAVQYAYFSGESLDLSPYQATIDAWQKENSSNLAYWQSLVEDIASHPEGHLLYTRSWNEDSHPSSFGVSKLKRV